MDFFPPNCGYDKLHGIGQGLTQEIRYTSSHQYNFLSTRHEKRFGNNNNVNRWRCQLHRST